MDDQAKAIDAIKAQFSAGSHVVWQAIDEAYDLGRTAGSGLALGNSADRAVSISRASQGSGVGTEDEVERAAREIDPGAWEGDAPIPTRADTIDFHARRQASCEVARRVISALSPPAEQVSRIGVESLREAAQALVDEGYLKGKNDRHGFEMDGERAYLVDADAFDALVAALSPHATSQARPDYCALLSALEAEGSDTSREAYEVIQDLCGMLAGQAATPQAPEDVISAASDIARSMTYDRALANQIISALADARLLATPVTVKPMEIIALSIAVMQSDAEDDLQVIVDANIGAGRIQIAGSEGPK